MPTKHKPHRLPKACTILTARNGVGRVNVKGTQTAARTNATNAAVFSRTHAWRANADRWQLRAGKA